MTSRSDHTESARPASVALDDTVNLDFERVAFVGLGRMGSPLATRLAQAGRQIFGVDPVARNPLIRASSLADLDEPLDAIVACVPGPYELKEVVDAIRSTDARLVVNLSTVGPEVGERVAESLGEADPPVPYVESPISGGVPRAAIGDCVLLCGAAIDANLQLAWPLLEQLGRPRVVGTIRQAGVAKLVNNVAAVGAALATIEALEIGVAADLDLPTLFPLLEAGTADSYVLRSTLSRSLIGGEYRQGFSARLALKDMQLALDLAGRAPGPMLTTIASILAKDCANGLGDFFFPAHATRQGRLASHVAPLMPDTAEPAVHGS